MPTGAQFDNITYTAPVWSEDANTSFEEYNDLYFSVTSPNQLTILAGSRCNIASHRIIWETNETLDFPTSNEETDFFINMTIDNEAKNYTTSSSTSVTLTGDLNKQYTTSVAGFHHIGGTLDLNTIEVINQSTASMPSGISTGDINYVQSPNATNLGEEVTYIINQIMLKYKTFEKRKSTISSPNSNFHGHNYIFYASYDLNVTPKLAQFIQTETELSSEGSIQITGSTNKYSPAEVHFIENQTSTKLEYIADNYSSTSVGSDLYLQRATKPEWVAYQSPNGAILNTGGTVNLIPHPFLTPADFAEAVYKFGGRTNGSSQDSDFSEIAVQNKNDIISVDGATPINIYFKQQIAVIGITSNDSGGRVETKKWNLNNNYTLDGHTTPMKGGSETSLRTISLIGGQKASVGEVSQVLRASSSLTASQIKQIQLLEGKAPADLQSKYNELLNSTTTEETKTINRADLTLWLNPEE